MPPESLLASSGFPGRTTQYYTDWGAASSALFYNAVRHGMEYVDPGASFYDTRYRQRVVENLHRRAKTFGYVLQPIEPASGGAVS